MARNFDSATSDNIYHSAATIVSAYPFTMACWFQQTGTEGTGGQTLMCLADGTSNSIYYRLVVNEAGANRLEAERRNTTIRSSVTSGTISADVWHHAVGVFTSATSMLSYLDGVAGTEDTNSVTLAANLLTGLGFLNRATPTQYLDGKLGEASIWNVALTADEVLSLSKGFAAFLIRPDALISYWPLLGESSPEHDLVGGFGMTVSGPTKTDHPRVINPRRQLIFTPPRALSFAADAGVFSLTGVTTNLNQGYKIIQVISVYDTDGVAAGLLKTNLISAAVGSYSLTGPDTGLLRSHDPLISDVGSYAYTGIASTLLRAAVVISDVGAYTLDGISAGLSRNVPIIIGVGSFTLSGIDSGFIIGRAVVSDVGSFAVTGIDASLLQTTITTADVGSFTLTGQDAALIPGRVVISEVGVFVLGGQDTSLIQTTIITSDVGTFTLDGKSAILQIDVPIAADVGAYTLSGKDITYFRTYVIACLPGSYGVSGQPIYWLDAETGVYICEGFGIRYPSATPDDKKSRFNVRYRFGA